MPHQLLAGLPEGPETRVQGNKTKTTKHRQNTSKKSRNTRIDTGTVQGRGKAKPFMLHVFA